MIPNFQNSSNKNLGSSFVLPAHGRVGARATSFLAAHFALQNTHSKSAEKRAVGSKGEAEAGCGGEFRLARAEAKPRRPARSEQRSAKKFSFPFRRKRNRAPN